MGFKKLGLLLILGVVVGCFITFLIMKDVNKPADIEVSHEMVVSKIESLGNLEVVKYNIQDVMEYKKTRQWLPNAKTVLIVVGEVIGCIDLTKLTADDIYSSGDSVRISLPAPEVCHVRIDHSRSKIFNMEYALWESSEIADEAYRQAEKQLQTEAYKLDLESMGRENTTTLLTPLLQSLGFKHIGIFFRSNDNTIGGDK